MATITSYHPWRVDSEKRDKLASNAGLWYNRRVINIVLPERYCEYPLAWIHSLEECIMDILRPRDENGKFLPAPPSPTAVSGIYQITNIITGDFYIGSSANIKKRWKEHVRKLRKGNYGCVILQRAWDKYGEEAFTFCILEEVECKKLVLLERERHYIRLLSPKYNVADPINTHLGMKRSEETKEKLRQRVISDEQKERLRQARIGKKWTKEQLEKRRKPIYDEAWRENQRQKHLGQKLTPEQEARRLEAMHTPEYREKQRQAHSNQNFTPEWRANISKAKMGHYTSPETIAKMNAARLQKMQERKRRREEQNG